MGKFLTSEKISQTQFKRSNTFSTGAQVDGIYKTNAYPFCLPRECAGENLFTGIREDALSYFKRHGIKWHDGQDYNPSNHLCDSQVCCVNFLYPFANQPAALAALLRPLFPNLAEMLPIEDEQFVAFEWIGAENYLKEKVHGTNKRTRGANFTSADAAVFFRRDDGLRQVVLIEWKYTESYAPVDLQVAASGTSRVDIYRPLFDAPDCPLAKTALPSFQALFYEPFYQLMRQQFLAHEMQKAHELGADIVSLLHISPAHNTDFKRITSPQLQSLGESATAAWSQLVKDSNCFTAVHSEELFGCFDVQMFPELQPWWKYLSARYAWVKKSF